MFPGGRGGNCGKPDFGAGLRFRWNPASEPSYVLWAGDVICLALHFLLCKMGLMVPSSCGWEGGAERMRGGPWHISGTSYFSQSIAISIPPLRGSWYRGGTDAFSTLWLDGVDCVSGTSNKEHHPCVPVISLGRPSVSELEGALCRVLHGRILFKSECFTDLDFGGFSLCKMPLP